MAFLSGPRNDSRLYVMASDGSNQQNLAPLFGCRQHLRPEVVPGGIKALGLVAADGIVDEELGVLGWGGLGPDGGHHTAG